MIRRAKRREPIPANDHSQLVGAFRDDAQEYCDFIDAWRTAGVNEPFTNLLRLLSNLAKSSAAIPFDFDLPQQELDDTERIDHAQWSAIAADIGRVTSAACTVLIGEHADDEGALVRVSMLWDDLADIYRDLRHGLDLYAIGDPEHIAGAVWQWRFFYEMHWGEHLFRALMTVHEIRFRLFIE